MRVEKTVEEDIDSFITGKLGVYLDEITALGARIIMECFKSGIREKDVEYFQGEVFENHCALLNLNYTYLKERFLMITTEDSKYKNLARKKPVGSRRNTFTMMKFCSLTEREIRNVKDPLIIQAIRGKQVGKSWKEVGKEINMSPSTVWERVTRALAKTAFIKRVVTDED